MYFRVIFTVLFVSLVGAGGARGVQPAASGAAPVLQAPSMNKPHPRLFIDQEGLADMRGRALSGREPFARAWERLRASAEAALKAPVPKPYQGEDPFVFYKRVQAAGWRARDLSLAYAISGNKAYADKAVAILMEWASAKPRPGSYFDEEIRYPNMGMLVARGTLPLVWTYDLLHDYPGMTEADKAQVQEWFGVLVERIKEGTQRWVDNDFFGQQYYQNHIASEVLGLLAIAYATGDQELAQYALDCPLNPRDFREMITGAILMSGDSPYGGEPGEFPVHTGEIYDRYRHFALGGHYKDNVTKPDRGLQYSHLTLRQLTLAAEICRQNGLDMYTYTAPGGENLELAYDFLSDFYRLKDSTLKGGFYTGESERLGKAGDSITFFELAYARYPENDSLHRLISTIDRGNQSTSEAIGWPVLTHGISP